MPTIVSSIAGIVTDWMVPLALAVLVGTLAPPCWAWLKDRDPQRLSKLDLAYLLTVSVTILSILLVLAAHVFAGIIYPSDRTLIYIVPLATLAWIALIERAIRRPGIYRAMGILASALVAIALLFFLRGFTTSFYYERRFDAGTKRAFEFLRAQALQGHSGFSSSHPMKIAVNWKPNYTFNFYRGMYQADWMAHVERDPGPATGGFDYYVLMPEDLEATRELRLRVIYHDPVSNRVLASRGRSAGVALKGR